MTSQSENMLDFTTDPDFEEPHIEEDLETNKRQAKSDLFILHMKKVTKEDGTCLAILATPASTVAIEQQFSAGGNILDARRLFWSPESIQVQVCVDDWTNADYRQQEIEQEVFYDFFDADHTTDIETEGIN
ncbi:hypothetical protein Ddye_026271 [Dipteronia dyeriana]|uniref:HAT C-terminal dimerisation domain-containing protein n=1 Tax=Dipteronia dyeriana TaxID=168575 RepID=A0AAD9WPE4_9ROSI|nr:hypothetical protein Ddye_026271 [Dipteronia dyeriana]